MYKSPLHILSDLETEGSDINDSGFLLRLRKKLLAEFDLSNSASIEINGKHYSKDEVIKTIDVLMGDPQMPLHSFIFANKKLLDFLENDASKVRPSDLKDLVIPEELKSRLSPILVERVSYNLKKSFHSRNFDAATELLVYTPELDEEAKGVLNEEISKNILNLQEYIESVRMNGCAGITKDLDFLKKNSLAVFLNKLPEDFIDTINSFVGEIINAMVTYQKTGSHDRAYLYYVSNNLIKIKCDEELMKLIKANHIVFTQNYEGKTGTSGGGGGDVSVGRIIYIILIVVVFIIRVATCSRNSSSSYDYSKMNNYSNLYSSLSKEKTEYQEFESYRKHISSIKNKGSIYMGGDNLVAIDSSISGDNPYRYILKRTSAYDYMDTSLRRVIINNTSGFDVIITVFNYNSAKGYYFFDGKPDTLSLYEGDQLCLYFGDSLSALKGSSNTEEYLSIFKDMYEVYFKGINRNTLDILDKDFRIEWKQSAKSKKSKKKKKPLPVIKLDKDFLETQRFENEKLKLYTGSSYDGRTTIEEVQSEVPPSIK